jgi:hypothetical protein
LTASSSGSPQLDRTKLVEELATIALTEFDAESRFLAREARGFVAEGIRLLDILDAADNDEEDREGRKNHAIPNGQNRPYD